MEQKTTRLHKVVMAVSFIGAMLFVVQQVRAAVPYTLGGDGYFDRVIADGGAGIQAFIATQGSFSSRAATGTNSHESTVNGARTDFGAGASDYASSDGTTVTFAGPIATATSAFASSIDAGVLLVTTNASVGGIMFVGTKLNMANADGGAAGNVTVNQPSGKVAIASGAGSMVLTNSLISAASGLHVNLLTDDTTCLGVYAIPGSTTVEIGCTGAATCTTAAGCNVFFEVRN